MHDSKFHEEPAALFQTVFPIVGFPVEYFAATAAQIAIKGVRSPCDNVQEFVFSLAAFNSARASRLMTLVYFAAEFLDLLNHQ